MEEPLGFYCDRKTCEDVLRDLGFHITDGVSVLHAVKMIPEGRLHVIVEGIGYLLSRNVISAHVDMSGHGLGGHPVISQSHELQRELGRIRSALVKAIRAERKRRCRSA